MEYILLDKIRINRPILFLCGPYYDKKNKSDRRLILQEYIYNRYNNKYLPLVIDDFLTEKNIKDDKIDIQLMEEICAAISSQTYIFLDTMSSAAELGIFANSAFFNKIKVFIPKKSDILNQGNVGYFVRDVVLNKGKDRVELIEYRPGIKRIALATDYITEHYTFVNDMLPQNIQKDIDDDEIFKNAEEHIITLSKNSNMPSNPYEICYDYNEFELKFHVSIKLLFYVTVSILSMLYKKELINKNKNFDLFDLDLIFSKVQDTFVNYISGKEKKDLTKINSIGFNTVLKKDIKTIIYHIIKFVHVYYLHSRFHSCYLMDKALGSVIEEVMIGTHPDSIFGPLDADMSLICKINEEKDLFYESFEIQAGRKKRKLVKYRDDENGYLAKELHRKILHSIQKNYSPSPYSFAYQNGKNIKQCVLPHIQSVSFMKFDISKFFNSIELENLILQISDRFEIDKRYFSTVETICKSCFYENELPLGLVLSPIFSDIYMHKFDEELSAKLNSKELIYSRYADDILISSKTVLDKEVQEFVTYTISDYLKSLDLKLNNEKKQFITFDNNHTFIKYLGVNIVRKNDTNSLSVGRGYINSLAKRYLNYVNLCKRLMGEKEHLNEEQLLPKDKDFLFYEKRKIIGQVAFISQIEGMEGRVRINKRLAKYGLSIDEIE